MRKDKMKTIDGFECSPSVWQMPDGWNGGESWTWGYVPPAGSQSLAKNHGHWSSKLEAEAAMAATLRADEERVCHPEITMGETAGEYHRRCLQYHVRMSDAAYASDDAEAAYYHNKCAMRHSLMEERLQAA